MGSDGADSHGVCVDGRVVGGAAAGTTRVGSVIVYHSVDACHECANSGINVRLVCVNSIRVCLGSHCIGGYVCRVLIDSHSVDQKIVCVCINRVVNALHVRADCSRLRADVDQVCHD